MEKRFYTILFSLLVALYSQAQIGYQVSLLNSATGEPRANETVSVEISITNSQNEQIYSGTQSATTNDFGVLSLQVGNANTFTDVDWTKLPFYVSATVDGVMIGKSQILNVPVAEAAKTLVGDISKEKLCSKTWTMAECQYDDDGKKATESVTFDIYNGVHVNINASGYSGSHNGQYQIIGNVIFCRLSASGGRSFLRIYFYNNGALTTTWDDVTCPMFY